MYHDVVNALEVASISSLEDSLSNLISRYEANCRCCDYPIDKSIEFRDKLDAIMNRFLIELAGGHIDTIRSKEIASTLLRARSYSYR